MLCGNSRQARMMTPKPIGLRPRFSFPQKRNLDLDIALTGITDGVAFARPHPSILIEDHCLASKEKELRGKIGKLPQFSLQLEAI